MKDINDYINSGILESYVLGMATSEEIKEVEQVAYANVEVKEAIDSISRLFEQQAISQAVQPDLTIKPLLLAKIDYIERLENGEAAAFPPKLDANSTIADFEPWLSRPDFQLPKDFAGLYGKIISHNPRMTTAVIWLQDGAPKEIHRKEYESFLIVEGSCEICIGEEIHQLVAGDFLPIPLHKYHHITVTSRIPCKAIQQRVVA
jgi:mannose-6-phosphate isomerase-like protein (cupin superfamily)